MQTIMEKEIFEQAQVLRECIPYNTDTFACIESAVKKREIDLVLIAARGTSDHAAVYGKYAIESLTGIPVALAAPSVSTVYGVPYRLKNALVIGISQSGEAADVASVIRDANMSGAPTIAITNEPDSTLTKEARHHLCCHAGKEISVAATKTFSAELLLLCKLAALLQPRADLDTAIRTVDSGIRNVLALRDEIFAAAAGFREMEECFTLSRGYVYCIALEGALKMQECAYVRAKAFPLSDFMHGPISLIEEDTPCFLYGGGEPFREEYHTIADRLREYGARLVVFSEDDELLDKSDTAVRMPRASHELLQPIYYACAIQLFACGLAVAKGLNPDQPRHIQKVTITK